jgi:hypothetical protein
VDTSLVADQVRLALRDAGYLVWEPGRLGFMVEADPQGGWVAVTCHVAFPGARRRRNRYVQRYREILAAAGFTVTDDPLAQGVLRVTLAPDAPP